MENLEAYAYELAQQYGMESAAKSRPWLRLGRRGLTALALAMVLAVMGATGGIVAKYVVQRQRESEMLAADFHISSNARGESARDSVAVCDANGDFTLALYNYETENTAAVSELDISYRVTVSGGTLQSVKTGETAESESGGGYTLPKGSAPVAQTLTVRPTAEMVTVTVETTAPYRKTLTGRFDAAGAIRARLEDYEGVKHLVIETNQFAGTLTVDFTGTAAATVKTARYGWTLSGGRATREAQRQSSYILELIDVETCSVNGSPVQ